MVRDVIQKTLKSPASEARLTVYGKITTVIIGLVALSFAFGEVRVLFWFVLFAWSGLGAAFTPVVLAALFWKGTTREGAIAGMVVGFLTTVIWVVAFKADFYDLYEMIPGFLAAFLAIVVVSKVTADGQSGGRSVVE